MYFLKFFVVVVVVYLLQQPAASWLLALVSSASPCPVLVLPWLR